MAVLDPTWSQGRSELLNSSGTETDPKWTYGQSRLAHEYVEGGVTVSPAASACVAVALIGAVVLGSVAVTPLSAATVAGKAEPTVVLGSASVSPAPAAAAGGNAEPTVVLTTPSSGPMVTDWGPGRPRYTLANTPAAPLIGDPSKTTLTVTVATSSNPSQVEYALAVTEDMADPYSEGWFVQADGSVSAAQAWQTYAAWGGDSGTLVWGLHENRKYAFRVKARNPELVETPYGAETSSATLLGAKSKPLRALVKISLTGLTLRFTDPPGLSMSDGHFWAPRLVEISELTYAFSSLIEPKQRGTSLRIVLDNHDDQVTAWLDTYEWGNRPVDIYVGEGSDLDAYDLEFSGIIRFPDTYQRDRDRAVVYLTDRRMADGRDMPPETFGTGNYPNLEDKSNYYPIPVVYGDFSDTADKQLCPAYCTDTTANQFKVAWHPIHSISQVYRKVGNTLTPISHSDEDLEGATFKIATYDPDDHTILVAMKGKTLPGGALMENPADIIEDLMTAYGQIPADDLASTTFDAVRAATSGTKCRRWIGAVSRTAAGGTSYVGITSTWPLITALCNEVGIDLVIRNGVYAIYTRASGTPVWTYKDTDIVQGHFRVDQDPENLYCNRLRCYYRYDPGADRYDAYVLKDDAAEQGEAGVNALAMRDFSFTWLWEDAAVDARAQALLDFFSSKPRVVSMTLMYYAIHRYVGDTIALSFDSFTDQAMQIREISKDLLSGRTRVRALIYP